MNFRFCPPNVEFPNNLACKILNFQVWRVKYKISISGLPNVEFSHYFGSPNVQFPDLVFQMLKFLISNAKAEKFRQAPIVLI